jgi:preprotein translocase subunit SecG
MYVLVLVLHLLVCLGLVTVVLLQSGKGGGLAGGAFGGSAQTVFGGRGATDFMTRATMVLGGAFFVTSLVLALMSTGRAQGGRSLIQEQARRSAATSAAPAGGASAPAGGATAPGPGATAPATPAPVLPVPTGKAPGSK